MAKDSVSAAGINPRQPLLALLERVAGSWVGLVVIVFLTFAVYARTLNVWFIADDFWLLTAARDTDLGRFIIEAFDPRQPDPVDNFQFYRPMYVISFKLCYNLFGLNATAYHALSIALHLSSVTLVWFIMRRLLRWPVASAGATLIFALHPAYAQTVVWIARANMLMATFAYLASLLLFLKYRDGGRYKDSLFIASALAFAAAVLYHPITVTLVILLPTVGFLIQGKPRDALRLRSWVTYLPFIAIAAAITLLQIWVRREYGLEDSFRFGVHQYLKFGEYTAYAALPILPGDWRYLHITDPEQQELLQILASAILIMLALFLLDRRRRSLLGVLASLWFFIALTPNTTGALLPTVPAQLYLPGTGFGLFLVVGALEIWERVAPALSDHHRVLMPKVFGAIGIAIAAGMMVGVYAHQGLDIEDSNMNRRFVAQLQESVNLKPGGTLYVNGPPFNLRIYTTDALESAVHLYQPGVEVVMVTRAEAVELEPTLGPNEAILRVQP